HTAPDSERAGNRSNRKLTNDKPGAVQSPGAHLHVARRNPVCSEYCLEARQSSEKLLYAHFEWCIQPCQPRNDRVDAMSHANLIRQRRIRSMQRTKCVEDFRQG